MRSAIFRQSRVELDDKQTSDAIPTKRLDAPVALGNQFHVCLLPIKGGLEVCVKLLIGTKGCSM